MSVKRGGLGRNLSALLSHADNTIVADKMDRPQGSDRLTLAITSLQTGKYQPRSDINDVTLSELAESIKKQGLLQPLVVREISLGRYEIIAGERRWRACQLIGMTDVPVVLRQVDDETALAMALVENLQRDDLNAMDQARAMHRLTLEFSLTHQEIADLLCKSRTAVSNYLRLLALNDNVMRMVERGDLDMGHARSLLALSDAQQAEVAQLVVARHLSVRETESLVARMKAQVLTPEPEIDITPLFTEQLQALSLQLQTKVRVKSGKSGKGMLIIHYDGTHGLQKMIEGLTSAP